MDAKEEQEGALSDLPSHRSRRPPPLRLTPHAHSGDTLERQHAPRTQESPQHEAINNLIAQRIAEAEAEIIKLRTDHEAVTVEGLKETLGETTEASGDFFEFAETILDDFERRGKLYTHKRYKSICKKFSMTVSARFTQGASHALGT